MKYILIMSKDTRNWENTEYSGSWSEIWEAHQRLRELNPNTTFHIISY